MFVVIYRGFVFEGREEEYLEYWNAIVAFFKRNRGAIGSALHRANTGEYVAYSRWPDKATRDASWRDDDVSINPEIDHAIQGLKSCLDRSKPYEEIAMTLVEDKL